ncbi:MAG: lytic transglycosylase domain-containing protein [Desulfobacterales bacterium]|nr:lytic transglycosylase domain-containing protein [Desulfobacterales bacterium]
MRFMWQIAKLIPCFLLLGYDQAALGAVRNNTANLDAVWKHYLAADARKTPTVPFPFAHCFRSAARDHDLPLSLLLAVARGESNFNPNARSDRNCHGLMQIQWPGTAKHLGIYRLAALYHPCTNINAGAKYLRELLDRYDNNLHLALAAYNYGPNRIDRSLRSGDIPKGAKWYSGYIYHHLGKFLKGATVTPVAVMAGKRSPYIPQKHILILTFAQPFRAAGFYDHLRKQAPDLNIEWYRTGARRYQVVLLYADQKSLQVGKAKLKRLGLALK